MKNLILSSLLLLILSSCAFPRYDELTRSGYVELNKYLKISPLINDSTKKLVYKTSINAFGNYLSGLMILKKLESGETRVAMFAEIGFNVFDFGFTDDDFKVYFIIEPMNKSYIINTFKNDIKLLLMQGLASKKAELLIDSKNSLTVLKIESEESGNYYYFEKDSSRLLRIENSSHWLKNVRIDFHKWSGNLPDSLTIDHFNFNLSMKMNRLKD